MESNQICGYFERFACSWFEHHDTFLAVLDPLGIYRESASKPVKPKARNSAVELGKGQADAVIPFVQVGRGNDSVQAILKGGASKCAEQVAQARDIRSEDFYAVSAPTVPVSAKISFEAFKH